MVVALLILDVMKIKFTIILLFLTWLSAHGGDIAPPENGKFWNELNESAKSEYVVGVIHGVNAAFDAAAENWLPKDELSHHLFQRRHSKRIQKVIDEAFTKVEIERLIKIVDHLYSDPANVYIPRITILYLARDKALGSDISRQLAKARTKALDDWELMLEHLKKKN